MTAPTSTLFDDLLDLDPGVDVDVDARDDRAEEPAARATSWVWELREIVAGAVVTALAVCVAVAALFASVPTAVPQHAAPPVAAPVRSVPGAGLPGIAVVLALGR